MPKPPVIDTIHSRIFGYHWRKTLMSDVHIKPTLSRLDGPAVEYVDGSKSWHVSGMVVGIINDRFIEWYENWEEIKESYYGNSNIEEVK